MYLPLPESASSDRRTIWRSPSPHVDPEDDATTTTQTVLSFLGRLFHTAHLPANKRALAKRDGLDTNATIGIIVGVLLGVFLLVTCAFLYTYRYTVRFSYGRKRRRRRRRRRRQGHGHKSGGSKSSKSSASSAPPMPAQPGPAAG